MSMTHKTFYGDWTIDEDTETRKIISIHYGLWTDIFISIY